MGYAESLLASGERVAFRARQHWLTILIEARWALLLILAAGLLRLAGGALDPSGLSGTLRGLLGWITLGVFVVGLAWLGLVTANWLTEEYLVTNRRVLKVEGLLNKHSADSALEQINDAVLDQHILGRILGYGDLAILTANEAEVDRFHRLARVIAFKKAMLDQKQQLEFEGMRPGPA